MPALAAALAQFPPPAVRALDRASELLKTQVDLDRQARCRLAQRIADLAGAEAAHDAALARADSRLRSPR